MLWGNNYNKMTTRHKRVTRLAFAPACGLRPFLYACACAPGACGLRPFLYVCLRPACGLGCLYIFSARSSRSRELRPGGAGQKKWGPQPPGWLDSSSVLLDPLRICPKQLELIPNAYAVWVFINVLVAVFPSAKRRVGFRRRVPACIRIL